MFICPVFGLVSRICPDLPISAALCLPIGGQKLAQILSVYTKKSLAARDPPRTQLGELMVLNPDPQVGPLMACACGSHTVQFKLKSNPTQSYIAPYIASKSRALGLRLDWIGYVKQFSLYVTLKTRHTGASSAVMSHNTAAGKVTTGLAESNGSLLLGGYLIVTFAPSWIAVPKLWQRGVVVASLV